MVDSWQFIIIDREVGLAFELFDIIEDVLLMLSDDPSQSELIERTIQDIIPAAAQEPFYKDAKIKNSKNFQFPAPPEVQYEGNRQRTHDPDRQTLVTHQTKMLSNKPSREANRFIRRVVDDMERCGVISLAEEYEPPQTRPVIIRGFDGALDLYFPYEFSGISPDAALTRNMSLPRQSCLSDFVRRFKAQHPKGIVAKGSILTHYCAWPIPALRRTGNRRLNFGTWEGHVYQWNAMRKSLFQYL